MKTKSSLSAFVFALTLLSLVPLSLVQGSEGTAQTASPAIGKLTRVTEQESAWAAEARKSYPLEVCVVSDEKLGSMGKPPQYVYRAEGQPDRLVVFCCSGCDEDFMKDPAAALAKLDAAAKAKAGAPAKSAAGPASK